MPVKCESHAPHGGMRAKVCCRVPAVPLPARSCDRKCRACMRIVTFNEMKTRRNLAGAGDENSATPGEITVGHPEKTLSVHISFVFLLF